MQHFLQLLTSLFLVAFIVALWIMAKKHVSFPKRVLLLWYWDCIWHCVAP